MSKVGRARKLDRRGSIAFSTLRRPWPGAVALWDRRAASAPPLVAGPAFECLEERLLLSVSFPPIGVALPLAEDLLPQLAAGLLDPLVDASGADVGAGAFARSAFVVEAVTPLADADAAAHGASPFAGASISVRNAAPHSVPGDAPRSPAPPAYPDSEGGGGSASGSAVASATGGGGVAHTNVVVVSVSPDATSPSSGSLTPAQVRAAYGFDQVMFGSIIGDGTGQTIAIIDAYDYPTALEDLNAFSAEFDLPLFNVEGGPTFTKVGQTGGAVPGTDPAGAGSSSGTWEMEAALDIEWAHAIAPMANILLVEATSPSFSDMVQSAVNWARNQPGVVAVSMSWSSNEFAGETVYDSYFTTPSGHEGVTFFAATGDSGSPSGYPAYSPNVVAVGGTTLNMSGTTYVSETGWSGSGGGISVYESQPAYQSGVVTQSTTYRANPDVAMVADPNTGVAVYDSWDFPDSPWIQLGGTSLATPLWAGLMAVVDQGRALQGLPSMDGRTQTLPALYSLPASDFHDIISGNNGYAAGAGYDLVTGRGTPIANKLIFDLGGLGSISGAVFQDDNGNGVLDEGESGLSGVTVYLDTNNNGTIDPAATTTAVSTDVPKSVPDNNTAGATSTLTFSGASALITDINITLSITQTRDADLTVYLIGPDGTQVTLFSKIGSTGDNFTNTTLDDEASTSIASAAAPFTGTYQPSSGLLAAFDGKSALGTWKLKVVDSRRSNTGSITAWSLTVTTAGETTTVTDADGLYVFSNVTPGTYYVRQVVPAGDVQTGPTPGANPVGANVVTVSGQMTGQNFGDFPTTFTASGAADSYYVRLDPTHTYVQIYAASSPLATPTYQVALSLLSTLTFNLTGTGNSIYFDFSNGSPVPAGGIAASAASGSAGALKVLGQSPSQALTMTDAQIGLTGGSAIAYQNFASMWLFNSTVNYSGSLSTLQMLYICQGCTFIWS